MFPPQHRNPLVSRKSPRWPLRITLGPVSCGGRPCCSPAGPAHRLPSSPLRLGDACMCYFQPSWMRQRHHRPPGRRRFLASGGLVPRTQPRRSTWRLCPTSQPPSWKGTARCTPPAHGIAGSGSVCPQSLGLRFRETVANYLHAVNSPSGRPFISFPPIWSHVDMDVLGGFVSVKTFRASDARLEKESGQEVVAAWGNGAPWTAYGWVVCTGRCSRSITRHGAVRELKDGQRVGFWPSLFQGEMIGQRCCPSSSHHPGRWEQAVTVLVSRAVNGS